MVQFKENCLTCVIHICSLYTAVTDRATDYFLTLPSSVSVIYQDERRLLGVRYRFSKGSLVLQNISLDVDVGENFHGISYDAKGNALYVVGAKRNVYKFGMDHELQKVPFSIDVEYIKAVEMDWVTGNIYFLDSQFCQILVCDTKTFSCGVVFREIRPYDSHRFAQLALDTTNRKMYWTAKLTPSIWCAGMDGSSPSILVSGDVVDPFSIAVNSYDGHVYWTDLEKQTIESCNMFGKDRKLVHGIQYTSGEVYLSFLQDKLFWTDATGNFIWVGNLTVDGVIIQRDSIEITVKENSWELKGILVASFTIQSKLHSNPCSSSNCSHICTLTADNNETYQCICPGLMKLSEDTFTCIDRETDTFKLLLTDTSKLQYGVSTGFMNFSRIKSIPGSFTEESRAIVYDEKRDIAFWLGDKFGDKQSKVFKWRLNRDEFEVFIDKGLIEPVAIALDWITGNLYIQDSGLGEILACNDGLNPCSVVFRLNDGQVEDIALDPIHGFMYWSMSTRIERDYNSVIWRAGMDGSDPQQIVWHGLHRVVGLGVNFKRGELFWSDTERHIIECSRLDGTGRRIVLITKGILTNSFVNYYQNQVVLHSIYGNKFWVFNMPINGSREHSFQAIRMRGVSMRIEAFAVPDVGTDSMTRNNPCAHSKCSHACVISPRNIFRCLCPRGMTLTANGETCQDDLSAPQMVIGYDNVLTFMTLGLIGKQRFDTITITESVAIDVMQFNLLKNSLFIFDKASSSILEFDVENKNLSVILDEDLGTLSGFDIDVIAQNLYWTDSTKQTIEVMSLKTRSRTILKGKFENGADIVVVPEIGSLFVAQIRQHIGFIWRMTLDGKNEEILTSSESVHPNMLFYERDSQSLFWVDQNKNEFLFTKNNVTKNIRSTEYYPDDFPDKQNATSDIVVFDNTIYWSRMSSKDVFYTNLPLVDWKILSFEVSESIQSTGFQLALMDANVSGITDDLAHHDCSMQNSKFIGCSHICISTSERHSGKCICPMGMIIDYDDKTCLDCLDVRYAERCKEAETIKYKKPKSISLPIAIVSIFMFVTLILMTWILVLCVRRKNQILSDLEIREFRNGRSAKHSVDLEDNHIFNVKYREDFEIGKHEFVKETSTIIGKGTFGVVYKSYMSRYNAEVAVKLPKSGTAEEARSLICEIKILSYVGEHPNIIKLFGAYTKELKSGLIYIVTELCKNGSLLKYLKVITTHVDEDELLQNLFRFCEEIAIGMDYLAHKNVIHGDLSARNVLLGENHTCKICDFGLSRKLGRYGKYLKQTEEPLPLAWLAVESLSDLEFSLKSDIWSMGVTYWEIFTLGVTPYPCETFDLAFIDGLKNGERLPKPDLLSNDQFKIILQCWSLDPEERPAASEIRKDVRMLRNQNAVYETVGIMRNDGIGGGFIE